MKSGDFKKKYEGLYDFTSKNVNYIFLYHKILKEKQRYVFLRGGTRSGKTYSALQFLLYYALKNNGKRVTVTGRDFPFLRRGAMQDFYNILEFYKVNFEENKSEHRFYFYNKSYLEFVSFDDYTKAKGAQRDVLLLDEANDIYYDIYNQLAIRTKDFIIFTYNPTDYFYIHDIFDKDFIESNELVTNYKDNVFLSEFQIKEIESIKDDYLRDVYVFGEFSNKTIKLISCNYISEQDFYNFESDYYLGGIDFGEGVSETAVVLVKYNKSNRTCYVHNVFYENIDINSFLKILKGLIEKYKVNIFYADYAQKEYINLLRKQNLKIEPCKKYDLKYSYNMLKTFDIYVVKNTYLEKEIKTIKLKNYKTFTLEGKDHAIDAFRYVMHNFF